MELSESASAGEMFLSDVVTQWENAAQVAVSEGIRTVFMRFGVVLGRQGGAVSTMKLPFMLGLGGPIGNGRQWFPWIHINDLVEAILKNVTISGAKEAADDERRLYIMFDNRSSAPLWVPQEEAPSYRVDVEENTVTISLGYFLGCVPSAPYEPFASSRPFVCRTFMLRPCFFVVFWHFVFPFC